MTEFKLEKCSDHHIRVLEDGHIKSSVVGPVAVIDDLMRMQEEARLYRAFIRDETADVKVEMVHDMDRGNDECAVETATDPWFNELRAAYKAGAKWQLNNLIMYDLPSHSQLLDKAAYDYADKMTAPPPAPEPTQSTTVEDAPVKMLLDLLFSEQMPPQRFVEEMYRRAATDGTAFVLFKI